MEHNYQRTIFLDIETAGLDIKDPIIEVAAVAVESATYRVIDTLDAKIEFEMRYLTESNYTALGINKFSAETWAKYALPSEAAAQKLSRFFKRYSTVEKISKKSGKPYTIARCAGHNSNIFDLPRIKANLFDKHDLFFHPQQLRGLDTEQAARWFFENNPGIRAPENYQLGTLIQHLGIEADPQHTALSDTLATVALAQKLAELNRITATADLAAAA